MKVMSLLLASALMLLAAFCANAMTAQELIDKTIEASGGLEALTSVQSRKMVGIYSGGGIELPLTVINARPDRIRTEAEFQGMHIIQCYADGSGWQINPMMGSSDPQELGAIELKGFEFQSDMDGPLIGYEKKGYTIVYIGEDDVEGTPAHHLHVDTNKDMTVDIYFDVEYFLPIMQATFMKIEETEIATETYLGDFKEVDGIMTPHSIETRMGGQTMNTIMVQSIEFGVEVADDAFDRPALSPESAAEGQ